MAREEGGVLCVVLDWVGLNLNWNDRGLSGRDRGRSVDNCSTPNIVPI